MKQFILSLLIASSLIACKDNKNVVVQDETIAVVALDSIPTITKDVIDTAVIYEANIRQYSASGHFDEFTKDIPQLKELGVKIIWLMPVFPISETKRKATGGADSKFATDFPEAEQTKYLGSYYAVSDFTKINPEFGTIEDFRELVKTAHDNGMFVILDWVPNHTGWDHVWLEEHPEFYVKNDKGEITEPLNTDGTSKGWGDVAQLDYTNMKMQEQMIKDMMYWVENENIDGFRCDHIEVTPVSFWEKAIPQLRAKRPLFMLAENDEAKFMKGDNLFDMEYGWKLHHLMNDIAKGKKSLDDFDELMTYIHTAYESDDILMNFVTNHDENSWAGTVGERLGDAAPAMLALQYMSTGMPLLYSGQEYDLNHRLKFMEKDSIPKTKGKMWPLIQKLGSLKNNNPALGKSHIGAPVETIQTKNKNVLMFSRFGNGNKLTYLANLSNKPQTFEVMPTGNYKNMMTDEAFMVESSKMTLKPWEYLLFMEIK